MQFSFREEFSVRLLSAIIEQNNAFRKPAFRLEITEDNVTADFWQWFVDERGSLQFESSLDLEARPLCIKPICQFALAHAENALSDFQRLALDVALSDIHRDIDKANHRFDQFLTQLEVPVLTLIQNCGPHVLLTVDSYNLLCSPATRERRRQAFAVYPWLGRLLFSADFSNAKAKNTILDTIDRGLPLEKEIEHSLSIPAWAIRRMKCCHPDYGFWNVGDKMLDIVHALSTRVPDIWPAKKEDLDGLEAIRLWLNALTLPDADSVFIGVIHVSKDSFAKEVRNLLLCGENIGELIANLLRADGGDDDYVPSLHLAHTYLNTLVRMAPGASGAKVRQLVSLWIKNAGLKSFINSALFWYETGGGDVGNWDAINAWEPVSSGKFQIDPWFFIELNDMRALQEEGEAMHHCAADHALACRFYGYRFFSLRDKNGDRLATVSICPEFQYDPDLPDEYLFYLIEIKGPANTGVNEKMIEAAGRLVDVINAPDNLRQRIAAGREMVNAGIHMMQRDFTHLLPNEIEAARASLLLTGNSVALEILELFNTAG